MHWQALPVLPPNLASLLTGSFLPLLCIAAKFFWFWFYFQLTLSYFTTLGEPFSV